MTLYFTRQIQQLTNAPQVPTKFSHLVAKFSHTRESVHQIHANKCTARNDTGKLIVSDHVVLPSPQNGHRHHSVRQDATKVTDERRYTLNQKFDVYESS